MAQTINNVEHRFNREHYPIGIAVNLVAKDNYGTLTTGVITCYADDDKTMCIYIAMLPNDSDKCDLSYIGPSKMGQLVCIKADELGVKYELERLLPEPQELSEMDYESALNEVIGSRY